MVLRTRPLVEGALMATLTVVLALLAFYVPVLGTLLIFFLPAPIAALTARQGIFPALGSVAVAAILLALFLGPVQALGLVIVFAFMGVALGWGLRRRWSAPATVLLGAGAALLMLVSALAYSRIFLHEDALTVTFREMEATLKTLATSGPSFARDSAQTLLEALQQAASDPSLWVAPGAAAALTLSFLYYAALRPLLRRMQIEVPAMTPFAAWVAPRWMAWVWFFTLLPLYLGSRYNVSWLVVGGSVAFQFLLLAFLVVGASVLYFYLRSWRVSPFFAYPLVVLTALTPFWQPFLALAGVWETLFGLRARTLQKLAPGQGMRAEVGEEATQALLRLYRPFLGPPPPARGPRDAQGAEKAKKAKDDEGSGEKKAKPPLTPGKRRKLRKRKR